MPCINKIKMNEPAPGYRRLTAYQDLSSCVSMWVALFDNLLIHENRNGKQVNRPKQMFYFVLGRKTPGGRRTCGGRGKREKNLRVSNKQLNAALSDELVPMKEFYHVSA